MRRSQMFMLVAIVGCTALSSDLSATKLRLDAAPDVPPAIAPAFALLDSALSPAQRDRLRHVPPDSIIALHFSLGLWLRNNAGLWRGSPVAESLRARGVVQPDDMSQLILLAYSGYLRGEPVDLAALARDLPPPPTGFKVLHLGSP